jgi:alkylation response protein AidB-like acyl-CoA dehydrogenase
VVLSHETARIGYSGVMVGMSGGTTIGLPPIVKYGTDEQKRQWLPGIFTGETSFCLGATEPSGMTLDDDVSVVTN